MMEQALQTITLSCEWSEEGRCFWLSGPDRVSSWAPLVFAWHEETFYGTLLDVATVHGRDAVRLSRGRRSRFSPGARPTVFFPSNGEMSSPPSLKHGRSKSSTMCAHAASVPISRRGNKGSRLNGPKLSGRVGAGSKTIRTRLLRHGGRWQSPTGCRATQSCAAFGATSFALIH